MRWGPQTWILAPAPMPFRVRPQASSPPLCTSAAYSVNHQNSNPLRRRQAFATPLLPQPSRRAHGTVPAPTPARPRDLETERKRPMPPRSTQSVLGSTPPPNLSDCSKAWERERAHAVGYGGLGSDQGRASERRTQGCEAAAESAARTAERGPHTPLRPGAGLQASVRAQGLRKRGRWADPHPGVWSLGSGRASSLPHALGQVSVNSSHNTDHGLIKMK